MFFSLIFVAFFSIFQIANNVASFRFHASCEIEWTIPVGCNEIKDQLINQMNVWNDDSNCGTVSPTCPKCLVGKIVFIHIYQLTMMGHLEVNTRHQLKDIMTVSRSNSIQWQPTPVKLMHTARPICGTQFWIGGQIIVISEISLMALVLVIVTVS